MGEGGGEKIEELPIWKILSAGMGNEGEELYD